MSGTTNLWMDLRLNGKGRIDLGFSLEEDLM